MRSFLRFYLAACILGLVTTHVAAEAPVVDESENFTMLDQQADDQPVAKYSDNSRYSDEEIPLANDKTEIDTRNTPNVVDKINGLQQEIQELRGQLEVQAHELKALQEQQLSFYKDLDGRIRSNAVAKSNPTAIEPNDMELTPAKQNTSQAAQPLAVEKPASPRVTRGNPADEQISYLAAYDLIKNKRHDEAKIAMQTFVVKYPQGGYTANAQYWLGELCMQQKAYPEAIEHFSAVLTQFPSSSKTAASMLKMGYAMAEAGRKQEAIQQLKQVLKNYPDTQTARLAQSKLKILQA